MQICDQLVADLCGFFHIEVVIADEAVRYGFGIISGIIDQDFLCEFQDTAGCAVYKVAVVGDIEDGAVIGVEGIFQNLSGDDVQVVGRLIEDEQICLGEHELGKGYTALFSAGELADQLEDVVAGEEEGGQKVPHLGVGHGRIGVGNLFKDRVAIVEDVVLLVIVSDVDIGAQADMALVLPQKTVQDLQDGGLARSVVADQGDMFAAADVEAEA